MKIIIWRSLCVPYLGSFNATERYRLTDYSHTGLCKFSTHREYSQDLRLKWRDHSNRLAIGSGSIALRQVMSTYDGLQKERDAATRHRDVYTPTKYNAIIIIIIIIIIIVY